MVFPKIIYYLRALQCGTSGVTVDLVAPESNAWLEDRPHDSGSWAKLAIVPVKPGFYQEDAGVLQAA